jgi:hypothetical protein
MESAYLKLAIAISINAVVMFFLTYAMIDSFDHFYANINRAYMARLVVAPMVIVMLVVMWSMYANTALNFALSGAFAILFAIVVGLMRSQVVSSMYPHHSSAIVMCEEASISNTEIAKLCCEFVKAQKAEFAQMQKILARY